MGKQQLSQCGGNCKEASAKTELYAPVKSDGVVLFSRVSYCINAGCGWKQKLPDVKIEAGRNYAGDSESIKSYLRRTQRRFKVANLSVKTLWSVWVRGWIPNGPLNFEEYLKKLEGRNRG